MGHLQLLYIRATLQIKNKSNKKQKKLMKRKTIFVSVVACVAIMLFASCNKEFHQYLVVENGTSDTLRIAVAERGEANIGDVKRLACEAEDGGCGELRCGG